MTESDRSGERPKVLLVEDDRDLADTYEMWLDSEYDVQTAYSGADGLTWYDSTVDIVLLDRRMPALSGTTVIRNMDQRDVDDQKLLLTRVEPGQELVDLPCDEYLTKPVTEKKLRDTVRELQIRSELDDELQRHFTLLSKITALENSNATNTGASLTDLKREAERTRARIEDRLSDLEKPEMAYRTLE